MTVRAYGYLADKTDARDFQFTPARPVTGLPALLDLRGNRNYPASYDQGYWGSCVGNAVAFAVSHALHVPSPSAEFAQFSRLQIYYQARLLEGNQGSDAGCQIRDAIKVVSKGGVAPEALWDYRDEHVFNPPTPDVLDAGRPNTAVRYARLSPEVGSICGALASGHPVVFGTLVYPSFESDEVARTGLVPMPEEGVQPLGGHAMVIVGYDMKRRVFFVRNSWSPQHGDHGHLYMPFDYVASLRYSSDFWTVQKVGAIQAA